MTTRNQVLNALLGFVAIPGTFPTSGRRLIPWTKVPLQPAIFVRHMHEEFQRLPTGMPAKVTMEAEVWIYAQTSSDVPADVVLCDLLDLVENALRVPPAAKAQTLGGTVTHCWIEGIADLYPGDLDNQAIGILPVRILVPSLQAS
jgi:hypothetical protein